MGGPPVFGPGLWAPVGLRVLLEAHQVPLTRLGIGVLPHVKASLQTGGGERTGEERRGKERRGEDGRGEERRGEDGRRGEGRTGEERMGGEGRGVEGE